MLTYQRTLKDGTVQDYIFTKYENNRYILFNIPEIIFDFILFQKYGTFNIHCNNLSNQGYGTALISIMLEIIKTNFEHIDFICGRLSVEDYLRKNWNVSIPFYLKQKADAYLIKENKFMRNIYCNYSSFNDFYNDYDKYYDLASFSKNVSDGYIIYPLVKFQNYI